MTESAGQRVKIPRGRAPRQGANPLYPEKVREPRQTGGVAVGAIRLSSLTDNTSSPERQKEIIKGEADLIKVDKLIYTEELDISATNVAVWDRPDLRYWLEHPYELDHLIVWKLDRACRNVLETAWLIKWALDHGVNVICNSPRLDLSTPLGRGIALFIGSIAEMEAVNIRERIMDARAYMARVARWPAGKPAYGYMKAEHPSGKGYMLVPDPKTAPVVHRIVEEYLAGKSYEDIAAKLTADGVLPPARTATKGKKRRDATFWHATAIPKTLERQALRNIVVINGEIQRDGLGEPLRYGPALIEDEQWYTLQAEMKTRSKQPSGERRTDVAPLLGVIRHVECKENMYLGGSAAKRSYHCNRRHCTKHGILVKYVEPYVEREFLRLVGDLEFTYTEEIGGEDHSGELAEIEESMAELERDRYERRLYKGDAGGRRFAELYVKLERRHETVSAKPNRPPTVRTVSTGLTYAKRWKTSSPQERRQLMVSAGAVLWVGPAKGRGSTEWEHRVRFEILGSPRAHEEGHDETEPRAHW